MSIIPIVNKRPAFLAEHYDDIKFRKYMFLDKNITVANQSGIILHSSKDHVDLICVSDETDLFYIGNFAEGIGVFHIFFPKEKCREATEKELDLWFDDPTQIDIKKPFLPELNITVTFLDDKEESFSCQYFDTKKDALYLYQRDNTLVFPNTNFKYFSATDKN